MKRAAVFLDRDGTVSCEKGYINHENRIALYPKSAQAIRRLNDAGVPAILITNQAGVARGYFPIEMVEKVHERLVELLLDEGGARLDGIFFCPHHKDGIVPPYNVSCDCRKPGTGLIEMAVAAHNIDPKTSFMVGDKISDVKLGNAIGAGSILVKTGYGRGELKYQSKDWEVQPDYVAEDLADAVDWILKTMGITK